MGGGGGGGDFASLILIIFSKYPMKMKSFGLKLFHFHRIFKNEGQVVGMLLNPLWISH